MDFRSLPRGTVADASPLSGKARSRPITGQRRAVADQAGCGRSTFCREIQARNHAWTLSVRFGTDSAM